MSRPEGKDGDTGYMWAGMHRAASESLMHATRDDDPRCVVVFATEAIEAGNEAAKMARNPRQLAVTNELLKAASKVKALAEETPEAM